MAAMKSGDEIYDVNKYTDDELYSVLDLVNPTDRELEARLYHLINKYKNMETDSGDKLANFFNNIYARFFELVDQEESTDGKKEKTDENMEGTPSNNNGGNQEKGGEKIGLTTSLEYVRDPQSINPLLKQTITRIISVDSQYRNNKKTTLGTNFSFNLSDSLRDVVALRLHSIQIPKTWYTINKNYGANFFYLKGNSPGINDGNHDYKIAVKAGNYTATELTTTVSTSIATLKSTYTDTSFGTSDITYNLYTGRATFTLDITKIYNEPSFSLYFPTFTWHESETSLGTFTTIPSILGYNNTTYVPNSAYSMSKSYADFSDNTTFWLTNDNNYFQIIQYPGYINSNYVYVYNDVSYQTITITSSLSVDASYSRSDLFTNFNTQLLSSYDLSGASIELIEIADASAINYGYYYYKFTLPLNPYTQTLSKDSKTVALFPNDRNVWIGADSCFKLETTIIELSDIKSESKTSTSDFIVGSSVYIYLKCKRSGYTESNGFTKNTVEIKITPGSYALDAYIARINSDIASANSVNDNIFTLDSNVDLITTSFAVNAKSEYKPRTRYYLRKTFGTEAYSIDASDYYFGSTIDMSLVDYDFSSNSSSISGKILSQSTYYLPYETTFFVVKPYSILGLGNKNAASYVITFTESVYNDLSNNLSSSADPPYYNDIDLKTIINYTIQNWQDPILGIYPFSETTLEFNGFSNGYINVVLNMVINVELTTKDFDVYYVDTINNSWSNYLYLDSSYNLESYMSYDSRFDFNYSDIIMSTVRYSNQITITSSNNTFYIKATGDGVYDSTGANTLTVVVDKGTYTVDEIIDNINSKLDSISPGSVVQKEDSGYVSLRMNVNKVFYTNDYRIVFYDPYSFVKCVTGASSVQNTSWDSTIGWILGFHTLTEYPLGPSYIEIDENDSTIQYYSETQSEYTYNTSTNIATLMGDTNVNVNLYNYFMIILDDYAQNHLNDGMVTITPAESNITPSSYANRSTYRCDPETGEQVFYGTTNAGNKNTAKEVYSANQKLTARKATAKIYSNGPFIQDIFALIPLNVSGLANGAVFTDTGSALNKQERWYFGPVNISRMTLKLINDRGEVVDLNGSNWSLSFQCDQLYQQKSTN